jgi:hypothetical protein
MSHPFEKLLLSENYEELRGLFQEFILREEHIEEVNIGRVCTILDKCGIDALIESLAGKINRLERYDGGITLVPYYLHLFAKKNGTSVDADEYWPFYAESYEYEGYVFTELHGQGVALSVRKNITTIYQLN